ncbi:bifunctional metallophosphatase/5'-nucleotidase [Actinomarinicola tropica]|uniref:Bifunctional metallophosphatase/5'-nucleotidase n=2 Tax=Actinomarinicola tropica TaxID=2789776 RepID=A0A5Q2RT26_9ACTN|nr:bifunctional metallophosphatase/5'-nucleotidase [Actinomarinicola tropica]
MLVAILAALLVSAGAVSPVDAGGRGGGGHGPGHGPGHGRPDRPDFVLTVLHNNDGESDLFGPADDPEAGTISRFGHLVQRLRWQATGGPFGGWGWFGTKRGVVTISAGDNFLAGAEWQASLDRGVPYYDAVALDHLDSDAFVIGNHEFDFGPEVLANFIQSFRGRDDVFLSANLDFSQEPSLQTLVDQGRIRPSVVVRERGERIGIIGVTTPELDEVSSPGDTIIDDDLVGIIQGEVDRMRRAGIDKILVASHLQDITNELELVTQLNHVDAVIGGGGGEDISASYPLVANDVDGTPVPVVTVPGDYDDVGRLVLEFDRRGNVTGFSGGLVPVTADLPQNWFIRRHVEQPVEQYLQELATTVVATSEVGLNGVRDDVRSRETNLGSIMADAHLSAARSRAAEFGVPEPQVALQNGGGIRNNSVIPAGDVTALDTYAIAAFSNAISIIPDVARADLRAAAEHGLAGLPAPAGSFAHWAGVRIEYRVDNPMGSRVVNMVLADGTEIVSDGVVVDGPGVTVATIDFLAQGQDGYDMFEPYDFTTIGVAYQQSLASYLASLGTVTAEQYADPAAPADRERIVPLP